MGETSLQQRPLPPYLIHYITGGTQVNSCGYGGGIITKRSKVKHTHVIISYILWFILMNLK